MLGLFKADGSLHRIITKVILYNSFDYYEEDIARYYIKVYDLETSTYRAVWVDHKTLDSIESYLIGDIK